MCDAQVVINCSLKMYKSLSKQARLNPLHILSCTKGVDTSDSETLRNQKLNCFTAFIRMRWWWVWKGPIRV